MVDALTLIGSSDTIGAKTWTPTGDIAYNAPVGPFHVQRHEISGLEDAAIVLRRCPSNAFVVRGRTVDAGAESIPYRRTHTRPGEPATLQSEAHHLLPVDYDGDGGEPRPDVARAADEVRTILPPAFAGARCFWQATSSAGIKPGIRVRLWFWCDRPVTDREARVWLRDCGADTAIYSPAQPIYVAAPRFIGRPDPITSVGLPRDGWLEGTAEVAVPPMPLRNQASPDRAPLELRGGFTAPTAPGHVGTRNNHLTSLAGTMRARGLGAEAIAAALHEHNIAEFPEPLPAAEVDAIARSVSNYAPETLASPPPAASRTAEKAARKAERDLADDPALLPSVAGRLRRYVEDGTLSEGQAIAAMMRGLERAPIASTHTRDDLARVLSTAPPPAGPTVPSWAADAVLDEEGKVIPCPENLRQLLAGHPDFSLWWNERSQEDQWQACPWHAPGPVLPTDDFALRAWVSRELGWHRCPADPLAAVAEVARARPWDPWRAWLEHLHWDGTDRLEDAAAGLLGAPGDAASAMFAWWLISAVARTYQPGCQADHLIVLEGPQGIGKTSFLRALAVQDTFFTRLVSGSDLSTPRTIGKIHGPVIVEMAELAVLKRAEVESIKAFVDEREDRVQWLYARKPVNAPRSCVFAATTNDAEYLRDVTGARRFWPIRCGELTVPGPTTTEQLWAEAVWLYKAGARWWPTLEEAERLGFSEIQAQRQETDPIRDQIETALLGTYKAGVQPLSGITLSEDQLDADGRLVALTASQACQLAGLVNSRDGYRVQRALRAMGWEALRGELRGARVRLWRRTATATATAKEKT